MKKRCLQKCFSWAVFLRIACLVFMTGCRAPCTLADAGTITSINIIDRNGMSETISTKERLENYNKVDFSAPQPYQKVLRVYGRDKEGNTHSTITSYHPNGQLKQSLEAVNNRAYGPYLEYYANGQKKIESFVIGGVADIDTQSESSWLFDGVNKAWDEEGHLLAEINYERGLLEGNSYYYHSNGSLWKALPYKANLLEGKVEIYLQDGSLFQTLTYREGKKEGEARRYWDETNIAYHEHYKKGELQEALYITACGEVVSEIKEGAGFRAIFGKERLEELHEYRNGVQEGVVQIFNERGELCRTYTIKEGEKEGEEIDYYPSLEGLCPKLLVTWKGGVVQGVVQSWYPSGALESRREMSQNKKSGLATGWYENGSVMYVEEYDSDNLVKGEYYRINEKEPTSLIKKGEGVATLFDKEGSFLQKVNYQDGKPTL